MVWLSVVRLVPQLFVQREGFFNICACPAAISSLVRNPSLSVSISLLPAHQAGDFGTDGLLVKLQRLFAAAAEGDVGLNFHDEFLA